MKTKLFFIGMLLWGVSMVGQTPKTYKSTILNTNFSIPIVRFNFVDNDDSKIGQANLFNSIGAGYGISWGELEEKTSSNGEISTEFTNAFGIHGGAIFSVGQDINVFAPIITFSLLDFELGVGY